MKNHWLEQRNVTIRYEIININYRYVMFYTLRDASGKERTLNPYEMAMVDGDPWHLQIGQKIDVRRTGSSYFSIGGALMPIFEVTVVV